MRRFGSVEDKPHKTTYVIFVLTPVALCRLTTDDNALRKGRHLPLKMAVECTYPFSTTRVLFPYLVTILPKTNLSTVQSLFTQRGPEIRPVAEL